jgi:serine/threonine protein kinase
MSDGSMMHAIYVLLVWYPALISLSYTIPVATTTTNNLFFQNEYLTLHIFTSLTLTHSSITYRVVTHANMAVAAIKIVFEKVESVPKLIRDAGHREYIPADILGTGGFASCWRTQMLDGREDVEAQECALKAVKAQLPKNLTQRFKLELAIQSKVHHPNIVEFYRAFTVAETTFVALELCPNGSLTDMIKKRKFLTMGEIRRILIQLCGAVKYLHQRDVVHRDIKAGNIFLDDDMNVKLGDFGLAAVMEPANDPASATSTHARRTTFCGTPNYLAPEILDKSGGGHGMSVDIWSIGILAYFLAVGKAPFHAKSKDDIYKKLRKGEYGWPELTPDSNEIPEDLKSLVAKLLVEEAKRPTPDKIVRHPFFSQGFIPSRLDPLCKTRRPRWARVGTAEQNSRNYKRLCWESQVGGVVHTALGAPAKPVSLVNELAEEFMTGKGISIPLKEGIVYRGRARRANDEIAFAEADCLVEKTIANNTITSPAQSRVLGEKAVNIPSPRPKLQKKASDNEPDIYDVKAMRESIDELQDRRAGAGTPPDPLEAIRQDSPRVVRTQNNQYSTPRKPAVSRPVRERRESPRRQVATEAAALKPVPEQTRIDQPKPIIDLTQSPPMFKTKSTLRISKPKRTIQSEEPVGENQQELLRSQPHELEAPVPRRMQSSLRIARTVSTQSGRSTPSAPDDGIIRTAPPIYETQTLGRIRRPKVPSRSTSRTAVPPTTSPASAMAAAAAAIAVRTSPQVLKIRAEARTEAPPSPQRTIASSRPVAPKRAPTRATSYQREHPGAPAQTLEAAIEEASSRAASTNGTIRRAPRRPRTAPGSGAEGLLLEALTAGDGRAAPVATEQREVNNMGTIGRRPRRAGVCYD